MAKRKEEIERIEDKRVDRIREVMASRKVKIAELAKGMGSDYAHLNKVLNGIKPLVPKTLQAIAGHLQLPVEYFTNDGAITIKQPKQRGSDKMPLRDLLNDINECFQLAEAEDIVQMQRFFLDEAEKPLVAVGSGGSLSCACYAALLYGTKNAIGKHVTPYSFNSISDRAISCSKVLIISDGGRNKDAKYAAGRAISFCPNNTATLALKGLVGKGNVVVEAICSKGRKDNVFSYDYGKIKDGFIGVRSVLTRFAVLYRAFGYDGDFTRKLNLSTTNEDNFTYRCNDSSVKVPDLKDIKHFIVLFGGYGEPVAYSIMQSMVEGGLNGSVMITDYRNECHGRFMFTSNHVASPYYSQSDCAVICLITPREEGLASSYLSLLPPTTPIVTIRTEFEDAIASIDLLFKSFVFVAAAGEASNINPNNPVNYGGIDKRAPISIARFERDFNKYGVLGNDKGKVVGRILKDEEERTAKYVTQWGDRLPLTKKDFTYRELHTYDTSIVNCWSWNSKDDVRDGINLCLGNMSNIYGVNILGIQFPNSEIPYQMAIFNSTDEAARLQMEIVQKVEDGNLTNGLFFKRQYIRAPKFAKLRRDADFEKGKEVWCYEWMKFVVWQKVLQNDGFKNLLLSIPQNAVIIEQAQRKTELEWGAYNDELKKLRKTIEDALEGKRKQDVIQTICKVNNVGVWKGCNAMGLILTEIKECLYEGKALSIDIGLLNDARINWMGKILCFASNRNGEVGVEVK